MRSSRSSSCPERRRPDDPAAGETGRPEAAARLLEAAAPAYKKGDLVATREAWGTALAAVGAGRRAGRRARRRRQELDVQRPVREGVRRPVLRELHRRADHGRDVDGARRPRRRFRSPSTFACFLTRAADFIRMAGISAVNVKLTGSHAGVSIGEDGPSQMALEDLAMMRAVPDCAVLYPCEAVSTERLVALMAQHTGPGLHADVAAEDAGALRSGGEFPIGGSKVVRQSASDAVTVVGAGVTVFEALTAADQLQKEGIAARVIDAYSVQPIDAATLREAAKATGRVITVEDHYAPGGLGDAVAEALAPAGVTVTKLAVREIPAVRPAGRAARPLRHLRVAHRRGRQTRGYAAEKHCMQAFQIMMQHNQNRQSKF